MHQILLQRIAPTIINYLKYINDNTFELNDDLAAEDDNYPIVDPADLNDSIPGITSNGYSMHAVSGRTAPHNPNNNNNLHQMNSYQSNQIGYNDPNNNSNNQSSNTGINSIHNHAQTGSNYVEQICI